jgi:hypothetical protein
MLLVISTFHIFRKIAKSALNILDNRTKDVSVMEITVGNYVTEIRFLPYTGGKK